MRIISYVVWIIVVIFGVIFATLNAYTVKLDYFSGVSHIFLPVLLFLVLIIGIALGAISIFSNLMKLKHANRKMRRRIHKMEHELMQLRSSNG